MSISFDEFVRLVPDGQVVGGQVILRVNGRHTVMGTLAGHTFNLTVEGNTFVAELKRAPAEPTQPDPEVEPEPFVGPPEPPKSRRGRPPKTAE
jgi:hypothetical protein